MLKTMKTMSMQTIQPQRAIMAEKLVNYKAPSFVAGQYQRYFGAVGFDEYWFSSQINKSTINLNFFHRINNPLTRSINDKLEGPNLTVCVDCKEMILQVIRAQSTARRIKMAKSLFDEAGEDQNNESYVNSDVWGEEFF